MGVFQLEFEAFAKCCATGQNAHPSIHEAAQADFWIDACYESTHDRKTVSFPSGSPIPSSI